MESIYLHGIGEMIHNYFKKIIFQKPFLLAALLIIAVLTAYWQTKDFGFVNYDDNIYVYDNKNIQEGITIESLKWAFTASYEASWQPVVWLSYLLDYQLHGMNPGWSHLINVFFHIVNTLLLFFLLKRITGALYRSVIVASLFALHPIHVESVVWITERKDVLCVFFWMLTIWGYIHFLKRPGWLRYAVMFFLLTMSLMTKPMPVTLPFTLLLLDFWPLCRIDFTSAKPAAQLREKMAGVPFFGRGGALFATFASLYVFTRRNLHLFFEKLPLFVPVIISSIITIQVSKSGSAIPSLEIFPLRVRIENAVFSYICYLKKMIWPFDLAVFYPHPGNLPFGKVAASLVFILVATIGALAAVHKRPWLFTGWFWYLGTLVPVIGILQIGGYAMADRFAYIPFIGVYIIIAWEFRLLFSHSKLKIYSIMVPIFFLLTLSLITWNQITYWSDSIRLFEHALDVTSRNAIAHNNLGVALRESKKLDEAYAHFLKALQIDPELAITYNYMGIALAAKGETDTAIRCYEEAIRLDPEFSEAYNNLGILLFQKKKLKEAIIHFQTALKKMPDNAEMQHNLSVILQHRQKIDTAIKKIEDDLGEVPDNPIGYIHLGKMYVEKGENDKAILNFQKALALQPEFRPALQALADVYKSRNDYSNAIYFLKELIAIEPSKSGLFYDIACLYARQKKREEAIRWLKVAIDKGHSDFSLIKTDDDLEMLRPFLRNQ